MGCGSRAGNHAVGAVQPGNAVEADASTAFASELQDPPRGGGPCMIALPLLVVVGKLERRLARECRVETQGHDGAVARETDARERLPLFQSDVAGIEDVAMRGQRALVACSSAEGEGPAVLKTPLPRCAKAEACLPAADRLRVGAQAESAGTRFGETLPGDVVELHVHEGDDPPASPVETQPRLAIGHVEVPAVVGRHVLRGETEENTAVHVLGEAAEAEAALRVPMAIKPAGVEHAFRAAAAIGIDVTVELLTTLRLPKGESRDAGRADLLVLADEPAVQLEAHAVVSRAAHVATDAEVPGPRAVGAPGFEQTVEVVGERSRRSVDGFERHRRARRV